MDNPGEAESLNEKDNELVMNSIMLTILNHLNALGIDVEMTASNTVVIHDNEEMFLISICELSQ